MPDPIDLSGLQHQGDFSRSECYYKDHAASQNMNMRQRLKVFLTAIAIPEHMITADNHHSYFNLPFIRCAVTVFNNGNGINPNDG
jgi:hypothetical protein